MKRIVILCDGTWNRPESDHPTNVVRLGQALMPVDSDDIPQVPLYIEGVGTGRRGVTAFSRGLDRVLGGALGLGLMDNMIEAYRHLVFLHEPGDEVFVFGFSRGAFTARSLVGFIRFNGLLARSDLGSLPEAVKRYTERRFETATRRQRRNAEWRAIHSPHLMTDPEDADVYAEFGADLAEPFRLAYLGVWDTVGALGVPGHFTSAPFFNKKYSFHDTDLTSMVRAARHAVALDERRKAFRPTLWTNLPTLNEGKPDRPYREEYFPGDHGSVGGGGDITGLSAMTLSWLMEGARDVGLSFDALAEKRLRAEFDPVAPLHNHSVPSGGAVAQMMRRFGAPRDPVPDLDAVSDPARTRWAFDAKDQGFRPYRPDPLRPLEPSLEAWKNQMISDPPPDGSSPAPI